MIFKSCKWRRSIRDDIMMIVDKFWDATECEKAKELQILFKSGDIKHVHNTT